MGITKNLAIRTIAKKEIMDLYAESLARFGGSVYYEQSKLINDLKEVYKRNYRSDPGDQPAGMDEVFYYVFANVYSRLSLELSYDPSFGTDEDYSMIFKYVSKNMYLFDNFGDALKLHKSIKDEAANELASKYVVKNKEIKQPEENNDLFQLTLLLILIGAVISIPLLLYKYL